MSRGTPARLRLPVRFFLGRARGYVVFPVGTTVHILTLDDVPPYARDSVVALAKRAMRRGDTPVPVLVLLEERARVVSLEDVESVVHVDVHRLYPWLQEQSA